jgi:hypothetical protein
MSKLEANTIDTVSGTTNLVIGSTNSSTVTFESGAATGHMSPAFFAHASSNTNISDGVVTTIIFGTEVYDTDSAYDNSNGRFTVPSGKAGKYFLYSGVQLQCGGDNQFLDGQIQLFKNGSSAHTSRIMPLGDGLIYTLQVNFAIDLVATDYIEIKAYVDDNGGTPAYNGHASQFKSYFGAYRIGA